MITIDVLHGPERVAGNYVIDFRKANNTTTSVTISHYINLTGLGETNYHKTHLLHPNRQFCQCSVITNNDHFTTCL